MNIEEKFMPRLTDEQVWLQTFLAVAQCFNSSSEQSRKWADNTVVEFRKRFPFAQHGTAGRDE